MASGHAPSGSKKLSRQDELETEATGTIIDRLTSIHNGRLGRLLNQLQILGMEDMHLQRIQSQLTSALGDDSGRKLRVLQQAIEQLAREKSLDRDASTSVQDVDKNIKPEDLERLAARSKSVMSYVPDARLHSLQQGFVATPKELEREGPNQKTPAVFTGDLAPMMLAGSLVGVQKVIENASEKQAGRPMIGAAVMRDAYDYRGDTQIDLEDKPGPPARPAAPPVAKAPEDREESSDLTMQNVGRPAAAGVAEAVEMAPDTATEGTKTRSRRKQKCGRLSFKQRNAALYHPHEDSKGRDMQKHMGLNPGGPGRFNEIQQENGGSAPMPGTAFWQCMLITCVDVSRPGSCGGHKLDPPLSLQITPTVCLSDHHKGGRDYATLYTDLDGFVYRGSLKKDPAIEWIKKMRFRYLRRVNSFKPCKPKPEEPMWVLRKPKGDMPGHEARPILDEAELRVAFSEANSIVVNLWQVYIRGPGTNAQICRIVHDFTGLSEEGGHYMLSCTHEMGSKKSFTGGYFVDGHDIQGTKAQGRATIINKVIQGRWREHVEDTVHLVGYAHSVFPFRRQMNGTIKQKKPKFSPDFAVVDFIVGIDGVWYFSNMQVLRAHRNAKNDFLSQRSDEQDTFGPHRACAFMENSFTAVKHSISAHMTRRFGSNAQLELSAAMDKQSILPKQTLKSTMTSSNSALSLKSISSASFSKKQTILNEREKKSFDPFADLNDDFSESSDRHSEPGMASNLYSASGYSVAGGSILSQVVGSTRRAPRPQTADHLYTGKLTLDKVTRLASNPRMQASGSRILKEILVARSRAVSAGIRRKDDVPSKVWGDLKKRITAVTLSDPMAANPANNPELLMRLGVTSDNIITNHDGHSDKDDTKSRVDSDANNSIHVEMQNKKQRMSKSQNARLPPRGEVRKQVTVAAAALGHPI